jgi:hypothetical protein
MLELDSEKKIPRPIPLPDIFIAQQMLNPDTAPLGRSVWSRVDQPTFLLRARFLESQNIVGDLSTSLAVTADDCENGNGQDPRYLLPLASEQRLTDDLAFLAAYEPGAGYVSATTVEAFDGETGIRICLAANRGVTNAAGEEIRKFFDLVERCARKGATLSQVCRTTYLLTTLVRNQV